VLEDLAEPLERCLEFPRHVWNFLEQFTCDNYEDLELRLQRVLEDLAESLKGCLEFLWFQA
jgi:hypothetical protein